MAALAPAAVCAAAPNDVSVAYLDLAHTTLTRAIDPGGASAEESRFVRVDVVDVVNPTTASLSFEVFFQPAGAPSIRLGTFSLFPADRPGTFIVATQGKVDRPGSLIVAMLVAEPVPAGVPLRVGIAGIALSSGLPRH